jgi:N-hydroxyarylamine O-acetyltransferase
MHLSDYLARINYQGSLQPDYETLAYLHQAHLLAIAYENLDIHLGRSLALDERAIFDKIVTRQRGGWCYEMNGLFAWALREAGFPVTLLASAVNRANQGDNAERNHLILLVTLDRPYLVDVGFGNGFLKPLPLEPGTYTQGFLQYQLAREAERWIFQNHAYGGAGYDFTLEPYALSDFADKSHELQTSPESGFVRVAVCHRFTPRGLLTLRGTVLRTISAEGALDLVIEDEAAYRRVLREQFTLQLSDAEIASLWQIVWPKHQAWLRTQV